MKYVRTILAAAGLIVVTGATGTTQADSDKLSVTLYTSAIHTGVIACNAVNVSRKTLHITISIIDIEKGLPLAGSNPDRQITHPGREATSDVGSPTDSNEGYCVFQVSGTSGRSRMRSLPGRAA
jgi:hypothetical protein